MNKLYLALPAIAIAILIAGCAGRPPLPARAAGSPADVDLSGRWALRLSPDARQAPAGELEERMRLPPASSRRSRRGQSPMQESRRSKGPAVHVFVENGELLKITQTEHGLFVSFDRAIVEEFTFGENRIVSLGPIEAQRVSGWDGTDFIVETMDDRGVILREVWGLAQGGEELVRATEILDGENELYANRQVFDRL